MPKYKLSSGKFIIVKDDDVQDFLNSDIGKGATVVEEIATPVVTEDYVKTPGIDFDDYLKPAKTEDSASADPTVESKDMGSKLVDGSLEFKESNQQALLNYKKRTGKEAGSIMDLSDEDYETPLDKFKPVDYNKVVINGRKKIKNYADERVKLAKKLEIFSYDQFGATNEAVDYVKQGLKSFDKKVDNEVKNLELNDEFKLRNDALNQLIKDTGNTQATGEAVKDVGSEFNVLNVFRGASYYKDIEADEVISLNDEVEQSVLDKLDKRSLQKLAGGFYTLQEKENLINESKSSIIDTRIKTYKDNLDKATFNVESKLDNNKKKLKELESFINPLENREDLTQEEANNYNDAVNQYNSILAESKNIVKEYNEYKTIETQKVESLEGEFGFDVAKGVLRNNFKLTDKVEKFREKYSGEGFWNGAADILGGEVLQGFYQTMKKATVGSVTWAMANSADLLTDQDSYSAYDAFSDVINNWSNKTLVPRSTSEEFDITKKEGGFKDFSARNYAKLGASMVPFTGYLISEVRKGKYNNIKQAIGDTYLKFGNKGKVLKDASQTLKNNIIMVDATFRATILDNQKEAEAKGFNGLKANSYATTVSATEAMVQMIMPDTQFLKGVKGKAILDNFTGSLKKAANKQAVISAGKEFTTNVLKEYGEEEINAFANMITDVSYGLALPKTSDFLNEQIQLTAGTLMLSGSMGLVGAANTYSNQKKLVYNQIHENINSLNTHLLEIARKSKNIEVKDDIVKAMKFAKDVSQAIESSPENVTSDQIDLLIKKKNLIDKKSKTDKSFHVAIDKSINEINEKIEAGSIRENVRNKFDADIKNISKSLNSSGTRVDETIVFEDSDGRTAAEKMKEKLLELGKSEEFAEANKNSYGAFIVDKNGKELLIVNKEAAVANSVVSTGQHEFLHKLLRSRFKNKPEELKKAANLLKEEVESINKKTGQGYDFISRLKTYEEDLAEGNLSESGYYEEVFTLFSEALSSKDIKINKSTIGKIGDFIRQSFQNAGFKKIKFNNADDVKNFIIDYNKAYSKGKIKGSLAGKTKSFAIGSSISLSKSVEQIQKEIIALEEQYDEQTIDYYDFENRMDILEAELEKAKKAPKETQVKPVKKSTQLSVQDIKDQIEQLDEDLYSGVIDDIDYEQRLDLLEERLKQAELRATNPKKAQENQDKIVKQSIDKFKKEVSEETVSDKNKKIAKINEDIANEMLELGANQVSDIEDPIKRKQIIDKLGRNNLGAVTNLTKRAAAAGKNLAIDDNLKIGYDEFFSGFSEELSALIKSYKVEVDGKRVPFGAYMNKNLPLRYGQILDNALKGRIEGSKSLDVQAGEKGYAGSIIADRAADFDATTSAEMGLPVDDLIDVTTFRKVKDKVETIKESIDLTDVDLDNLTYRKIQDDYSGQVGAELIGMWDRNAKPEADQDRNDFQKLAERIEGTRTLNYGKDTGGEAEVRAMQGLFLDYNDAVKFIKTMPEFNVAPFETTIDEQGRSIDLTEDARGYSTGISNKLLKEFYEPYIDPKSKSSDKGTKSRAITSPSGRGKGKTSQVAKVYRLKPEYRGKISRQTVQELQKKIGITPAGEAFIPMKGKNRTEFGTALQGLTKMYATNVANTIIRKKIVEEGLSSERKTPEKLLADIGGGKSSIMFSRAADLGLNVPFETPQLGNVLFSKKARAEYESVLRNKRPDLENPREQVDELIKWGDALNVKENKKAKYKKLALYYMANGFVIMPEDGYKVVEAIRLGEANKVDPYTVKNPNELIERYQAKTKGARINPDEVEQFSNKKALKEGVVVYDVEDSKKGQLALRKVIDTNWGYKANPWCLAARSDGADYIETNEAESREEAEEMIADYKEAGYHAKIEGTYTHKGKEIFEIAVSEIDKDPEKLSQAFKLWKSYNEEGNGFKIAFQNGKLISFRDGDKMEWWDRMDRGSVNIPLKPLDKSKKQHLKNLNEEKQMDPETGEVFISKRITENTIDGGAIEKITYVANPDTRELIINERSKKLEIKENILETEEQKYDENGRLIEEINTIADESKGTHVETTINTRYDKKGDVTGTYKTINTLGEKFYQSERIFNDENNVYIKLIELADAKVFFENSVYLYKESNGKVIEEIDNRKKYGFDENEFLDSVVNVSFSTSALADFLITDILKREYGYNKKGKLPKIKGNKKELNKIITNLLNINNFEDEEAFNDYVETLLPMQRDIVKRVFEGRYWMFGLYSDEKAANNGIKYEKLIRKAIKESGVKGVSVEFSEGGFSSGTDLVLTIKGKNINIELKLNRKAQFGSFMVKQEGDKYIYTSGISGLQQSLPDLHEEIQNQLKSEKYKKAVKEYINKGRSLAQKLGVYFKYNEDTNTLKTTKQVFEQLATDGYLKKTNLTIRKDSKGNLLNEDLINTLYNNKDVYYIEIGGKGLYYLKENKDNLNIPKLEGNTSLVIRNTYNQIGKTGIYQSLLRGFIKLDSDIVDSNISFADVDSIKENLQDISGTSFSKGRLDAEFNKIIENKTGILATDEISEVKAKMIANNKRSFNIFIPPSAEDFVGLLYATLGKGKVGEKQMMFYDRTLIRPYARAMQAITRDRIDLGKSFNKIRKQFNATPKDLKKKVPNSLFTKEQAVRIYIWDSIGKEVPGLNVEEVNELANYVADNKELRDFADQVMRLNPGSAYTSPGETWTTGTITTDLLETLNESRRAKHLGRWQQNVDEIFSKENLNKLEAAYGTSYRKAMENMLTRMKTGRNRTYGTDSQTAKWIDWVNGSVGTIMFLNARSAVLQTISAANFINFGDNNVFAAGKAFANQKQYWSDFAFLMNSDYLVERRDSLKININEADIAEAAQKKGARGAINYLLKLGFTPTKFADSFAIASGGATFYRNRLNALIKKGMDPAAAEKAAMRDFIEKSEESQQSSRPDKISQEQAGPLGRVILAFANTPAQYARIIKKAASDLKNRRGSDKENISKIIYYGLAQNLLFNALQQAIFAVAFGDEEDEGALDDKKLNIVNGMLDGIIRGTGVGGAIFTVVKNSGLRIYKESNKKRPNYESVVDEALKISPPISSKISKLKSAGRTFTWDAKEIKGKGLDITNPAIGASAKILSAGTNLPLDRVVRKIENLKAASDSELETYKRLALVLGWGKWELGIKDEKWKDPNAKPKIKNNTRKIKQRKIKQRKITIR